MTGSNTSHASESCPRLSAGFFQRDVLEVAPDLLGKLLVRRFSDGRIISSRIIEVEAYRGTDDLACHASKGRTARTKVMFGPGGHVYMYLIYGMYWMLNFVTGELNVPQAVLLRGVESVTGPGRLTREFEIGREFYGCNLGTSPELWVEDHPGNVKITAGPRIGVTYAGEPWASKPWRFTTSLGS
ncbi:DNA-3-methyladenine glycosylase [Bacteroidota bacterium]